MVVGINVKLPTRKELQERETALLNEALQYIKDQMLAEPSNKTFEIALDRLNPAFSMSDTLLDQLRDAIERSIEDKGNFWITSISINEKDRRVIDIH
jgi:hypothetical protein